jgi:parallel beta-helix repeat protein
MSGKGLICVFVSVLVSINLAGCTEEREIDDARSTLYVDVDGGADFVRIQDAINNIEAGGTVYVKNGSYNELIYIRKSISLIGDIENGTRISYDFLDLDTRVDGIVTIGADNCTITGFNISFGFLTASAKGIYVTSSNNVIDFCNLVNVYHGIVLERGASNNVVSNCTITDTKRGIYVNMSESNLITRNKVTRTGQYSIYMHGANSNVFSGNFVVDNDYGVRAQGSDNNLFYDNTFKNNSVGIRLCCGSEENVIYGNNFIGNNLHNALDNVNNIWDNGTVGNYWDDYAEKYPNASQADNIWDTPYAVCDDDGNCGDVFDMYPMVSGAVYKQ